jgi:hypothetical protein
METTPYRGEAVVVRGIFINGKAHKPGEILPLPEPEFVALRASGRIAAFDPLNPAHAALKPGAGQHADKPPKAQK